MSEFRRFLMSSNKNDSYERHYIIQDGVLVDSSVTLDTMIYGSRWSSTDNRLLTYHDGYIQYYGSCINRNHGVIFKPFINSEGYHTLCIEMDRYYDSTILKNGIVGPIIGLTYGITNSGYPDEEMGLYQGFTRGWKYYYAGVSNFKIFTYEISDLDEIYLFLGSLSIQNPDYGTTIKIYNIWLEKGVGGDHTEVNYIQLNNPGSTTEGFCIDTEVYCTTLDYKLEYDCYGTVKWGYIHNNKASGTWISLNVGTIQWNNYTTSYVVSSNINDTSTYHILYDMQSGLYKDGILVKSFTASEGSANDDWLGNIKTRPIYYGGTYDFETLNMAIDYQTRTEPVRYYPLRIYKGNELIRQFIPVIRNGEYCMYDKINKKYHYNLISCSNLTHG